MPSLHPTASTSALTGPAHPTVPSVQRARTPTHAVSVETPLMEPGTASPAVDPRIVVTPLIPAQVEELLRKYNIFDDWHHIVDGIRNGFNVGVSEPPSSSHTFRKSFFFIAQPLRNRCVHSFRAGSRQILCWLHPFRLRAFNRPISYIPSWPCSKTALRQISYYSRSLLSSQPLQYSICQCWNQRGRLPDSLGHIRRNSYPYPFLTAWLRRCNLRRLLRIPHYSRIAIPAELPLHILERPRLRRSCTHVRSHVQRRCLWLRRRHVSSNLWQGQFQSDLKMGGRFLRRQASPPVLDRGGLHSSNKLLRSPMESRKVASLRLNPKVYRVRLGPQPQTRISPRGETSQDTGITIQLAAQGRVLHGEGGRRASWQTSACSLYLPLNTPFLAFNRNFCSELPFSARTPTPIFCGFCGHPLDPVITFTPPQSRPVGQPFSSGYWMVGRRQLLVRNRHCHSRPLGRLALGTALQSWAITRL